MGGTIIPMTTSNITYRDSFHIVSSQTARATCLCHGVLVIFMPSLPIAECPGCWYLHVYRPKYLACTQRTSHLPRLGYNLMIPTISTRAA